MPRMSKANLLRIPPTFYTTMQRQDVPFPHEDGDTLPSASLRIYWYGGSIFRTYCAASEAWEYWRESETIQAFVEFYLRCKCLLVHMELEDAEFYAAVDRATTITQILLYDVLQMKREEDGELCRKWRDAVVAIKSPWIGMAYSMHKKLGTSQTRKEAIKAAFAPLLELERMVRLL
jgi:hypothetical protein